MRAKLAEEARIMFLQKFKDGLMSQADISYYDSNQGWLSALGVSPSELIDEYKARGLIARLNANEHLHILMNALLSVATLKEGLASVGSKKTGRKSELVDRLIEVNREVATKLLPSDIRWSVTEEGDKLVNAYRAKKKEEKESLEDDLLDLISNKKYLQASIRRAEHNARQVFPPGLGCSWDDWDTERDVRILETINSLTPQVLLDRSSDDLQPARLIASLSYLMGSKLSSRLHGLIYQHGNDKAEALGSSPAHNEARLLQTFAIGKVKLDEWRDLNICRFVKILDAGDDSCPECRVHAKKKYSIDRAPELPSKICTHPIGCRCCYVPA